MGYFVEILQSNWTISHERFDEALQVLKDLNKPENNSIKRGGSFNRTGQTAWWFSWMEPDYDQTVTSVKDVFDMLGFDSEYTEDGDLQLTGYDNKTGQEDLFLEAVAPFSWGAIEWQGEDGSRWVNVVADGRMKTANGQTVYNFPPDELPQ